MRLVSRVTSSDGAGGLKYRPGAVATLDAEEAQWRRDHAVVRVGVFAGDHLPAETWVAGHPEGLGPDYARLLASKVGLRLSFDPFSDWQAISWPAASQPPRYELLVGQPDTPGRRGHLAFLRPYLKGYMMLVARRGDPRIRSEASLARLAPINCGAIKTTVEMTSGPLPAANSSGIF